MLIMTRKPVEFVDLTVPPSTTTTYISACVLGVSGNQVRLGFEAPLKVVIDRREVTERKQNEFPCHDCGGSLRHADSCPIQLKHRRT